MPDGTRAGQPGWLHGWSGRLGIRASVWFFILSAYSVFEGEFYTILDIGKDLAFEMFERNIEFRYN